MNPLEQENAELKQQLAQFHEALERSRQPDWEKWLNELAEQLEFQCNIEGRSYTYARGEAARQLRYMATSFTLKANFVPLNLRVKELETELAEANHWRERHSKDAEAYGKQSQSNWELLNTTNLAIKRWWWLVGTMRKDNEVAFQVRSDMESFMREHNIPLERPINE